MPFSVMHREAWDPRHRAPLRQWPRQAVVCLLLWGTWGGMVAHAKPEGSVKAAFVFNFLRFAEWPRLPTRGAVLSLCLWGADARLSETLKRIAGRTVDQRPVWVVDIGRPEDLEHCYAVFIPDPATRSLPPNLLRKAESMSVLTLSDAEGFAAAGGMIGLVADGRRMRFEINDRAVKRSGVKLGVQLYQLGRLVPEGGAN